MVKIPSPKYEVFISYPGSDGKPFAVQTKSILDQEGYKTWVYTHDRTFGQMVWDEIADVITNKSDLFIYLCTQSSLYSRGQSFESEYAMQSLTLMPQLIVIDNATYPLKLKIFNRENVSSSSFSQDIAKIAKKLIKVLQKSPVEEEYQLKRGIHYA